MEPPSPHIVSEEEGGGEAGLEQSSQAQAGDGAMPEASSEAKGSGGTIPVDAERLQDGGKAPPVGAQSFFLQGSDQATPTGEKLPQESGPMSRQT